MKIGIVIPACDEQETLGQIIRVCCLSGSVVGSVRVVVCDNDSHDRTAETAEAAGAEVVSTQPRGYGRACLTAVAHLGDWPQVIVFLDADGSSRPDEIPHLLKPIQEGRADFVLGCRRSRSHMTLAQDLGTRLVTRLISLLWGKRFEDIGPFRAIRFAAFDKLGMKDTTWGWTVEMQILAILHGLRIEEIPVSWEKRVAGVSKISGTFFGVLRAGSRMLWTIARYALRSRVVPKLGAK